eukprot:TRINITY_DN2285_c0_g4_i1.p2 TRINITY_DN2285_c0_g4~~TRINITY_DN2285_c0_g4_i1.p2  ORF type:complete len:108 (+),score=10.01 TRINITY_DN2285_c0_g4_i1:378-701(+)
MGVPGGTGGMRGLSTAAAAGLPADTSVNGTTATGLAPCVGVPGGHPKQWGPAFGGAPKRIFAEPRGEHASARADAYGDKRTESPSSVLHPLPAKLCKDSSTSSQGSW